MLLIGGIDPSVGAAAGLSAIFGSLLPTQTGINPYAVLPITALHTREHSLRSYYSRASQMSRAGFKRYGLARVGEASACHRDNQRLRHSG